ncbi:MAG: cohesin domain-containing protein [Candidatus Roizmanbacteria bacterium]|nr:cohesin domain-containing protein [Candidatus Roizmanbacteria bacterium]
MKINKHIFTAIVVLITTLFLFGLVISIRYVQQKEPVQSESKQINRTGTTLKVTIPSAKLQVGTTIKVTVSTDATYDISATDIVLTYDPVFLAFNQDGLVSADYTVVRVLPGSDTLVISLLNKDDAATTKSQNNNIVTIPFTLLKKGVTSIKPLLSETGMTSTLLFGSSTKNQLSRVLPLQLTIQ